MRSVVLLDTKIDKDEALTLLGEYGEYMEKHTGVQYEYWVERRDFSQVPTVVDVDGDMKPSPQYISTLVDDVHSRYGDDGTDNVVMWVHEDNFLYKGIWGQNWSYVFKTYSFQLCRWDKDNPVNTFNTLLHEQGGHPLDRVILEEIGIDINPIIVNHFGYTSFSYDRDFVHGNHPDFPFIGRRGFDRNDKKVIEMYKLLAPYIKRAYQVRRERHFAPVKEAQWTLIDALSAWIERFLKK